MEEIDALTGLAVHPDMAARLFDDAMGLKGSALLWTLQLLLHADMLWNFRQFEVEFDIMSSEHPSIKMAYISGKAYGFP
jgi:hypothetical protein